MIRRIDLRGAQRGAVDYSACVPRADFDVEAATHQVRPILEACATRGVEAMVELTERFDGVRPRRHRGAGRRPRQALAELDPAVRAALEESIRRLRQTCEAELEHDIVIRSAPAPA